MVQKQKRGTSTDVVLLEVYNSLVSDFQRDLDTRDLSRFRFNSVAQAHSAQWPSYSRTSVAIFKRYYQLEKFWSRYTADDDLLPPKLVAATTFDSLESDTIEAAEAIKHEWKLTTWQVVREARRIAKKILGEFSKDEWYGLCRFGRRASQDVPMRESYLHRKAALPISCSNVLVAPFEDYLKGDTLLSNVFEESSSEHLRYTLRNVLTLSLVPKKFDKLRPVTPYSTVASFLSLGLGEYIRARLREQVDIDISRQQDRHRKAVIGMSRDRFHVTADMKAASTMITSRHVRAILPYQWYKAMQAFHVPLILWKPGKDVRPRLLTTNTFAGMGCGFTFPLQTLVFYCVLSAIKRLSLTERGYVSVYGDDLIYPRKMHTYVMRVFEDLGFCINRSKTFVDSYFRESCGEDAFHGVSVRPFCYEGTTETLKGPKLGAFLYKILNGLLHRWRETEIPITVETLRRYISASYGYYHVVPPYFPDYSGEKVYDPSIVDWRVPAKEPFRRLWKFNGQKTWIWTWQFSCIRQESERLVVPTQFPYYWDSLRTGVQGEDDLTFWSAEDRQSLNWCEVRPRKMVRTRKGTRLPKLAAWVTEKGTACFVRSSGSAGDWLETDPGEVTLRSLGKRGRSMSQ